MKNASLLVQKINEGIDFIQKQNETLNPVIEYLTDKMLHNKEELTAKETFDYYIRLQELKVNSLLLLTKMKEILEYKEI